MSESATLTFQVHSEQRGHHWVAWLTRGNDTRPVYSVLLVGETREEAESRAREWSAQVASYAPRA
jgi:hypothetical protein